MSAPAGDTDASPVRVLVADDDADIRDLVEFKLTQAGYAVEAVPDGISAWEAFVADPPQLAVLDVMPRERLRLRAGAAPQRQVARLRRRYRFRRGRRRLRHQAVQPARAPPPGQRHARPGTMTGVSAASAGASIGAMS
jgi:CheY-like chemotaxis protein